MFSINTYFGMCLLLCMASPIAADQTKNSKGQCSHPNNNSCWVIFNQSKENLNFFCDIGDPGQSFLDALILSHHSKSFQLDSSFQGTGFPESDTLLRCAASTSTQTWRWEFPSINNGDRVEITFDAKKIEVMVRSYWIPYRACFWDFSTKNVLVRPQSTVLPKAQ